MFGSYKIIGDEISKDNNSVIFKAYDDKGEFVTIKKIIHPNTSLAKITYNNYKEWMENQKSEYFEKSIEVKDIRLDKENVLIIYPNSKRSVIEHLKNFYNYNEIQSINILLFTIINLKYFYKKKRKFIFLNPGNLLDYNNVIKINISKQFINRTFNGIKSFEACYLAPEVLRYKESNFLNEYSEKTDFWSLGIIFFKCLFGYLPFNFNIDEIQKIKKIKNQEIYIEKLFNLILNTILNNSINFEHEIFTKINPHSKDILKRLLTINPEERIEFKELLGHKVFQYFMELKNKNSSGKMFNPKNTELIGKYYKSCTNNKSFALEFYKYIDKIEKPNTLIQSNLLKKDTITIQDNEENQEIQGNYVDFSSFKNSKITNYNTKEVELVTNYSDISNPKEINDFLIWILNKIKIKGYIEKLVHKNFKTVNIQIVSFYLLKSWVYELDYLNDHLINSSNTTLDFKDFNKFQETDYCANLLEIISKYLENFENSLKLKHKFIKNNILSKMDSSTFGEIEKNINEDINNCDNILKPILNNFWNITIEKSINEYNKNKKAKLIKISWNIDYTLLVLEFGIFNRYTDESETYPEIKKINETNDLEFLEKKFDELIDNR